MSDALSRTKIAKYVSSELQAGNGAVMKSLAAYLIDSKREREADLIVRSILEHLESEGVVLADVTSAYALDEALRSEIKALTGAKTLEIRAHVDDSVLGGVRIETPACRLDTTFAHRLMQLRERKI